MKKHFVKFFSPGAVVPETTKKEIDTWDVNKAVEMSKNIVERYNSRPFGFRFSTRSREENELDSIEIERSCFYYLGGQVKKVEELNPETHAVAIGNMKRNNIERVVITQTPWEAMHVLEKEDVVLDVTF